MKSVYSRLIKDKQISISTGSSSKINPNLDIIIGFFFFLFYKFFLLILLFKDRLVPPEPDDSYFYLASAQRFPQILTFEDFRLAIYSFWIKLINLFTADFEKAYQLNFYLGTFILFFVVVFFIRRLEVNVWFRGILITFLGLYNGSGVYHGFYWVVPSFYQVVFYLILLALGFSSKMNLRAALAASFLFIFIHPSSMLFSLSFLIISLLLKLFTKSFSSQSYNFIKIFGFSCFFFIIYFNISLLFSQENSPEAPLSIAQNLHNFGNSFSANWPIVYNEYFRLLFLHPIVTLGFLCCLIFVYLNKQYQILSIYLSLLVVMFISMFFLYGYRSLGFLWPITFLIFGYGVIGIINLVNKKGIYFSAVLGVSIILVFFIVATSLNYIWITYLNRHNNYYWDRSCPAKLLGISIEPLHFNSKDAFYAFMVYDFPMQLMHYPPNIIKKAEKYQLLENSSSYRNEDIDYNPWMMWLISNISRSEGVKINNINRPNYWNTPPQSKPNQNGDKVLDCGKFIIKRYENEKNN